MGAGERRRSDLAEQPRGAAGPCVRSAAAGARAIGIVVGTRYIHTVAEMIEKSDLQAALDILVAYLKGK